MKETEESFFFRDPPEPVEPSMKAEDFEIVIARGSSRERLIQKLRRQDPDYFSGTLEFLIAENGKVYLSHVSSHAQLQEDVGIASVDILSQGNLSVYEDQGRLRPIVRPKCCDISGTQFLLAMERRIEAYALNLVKEYGHKEKVQQV